MTCLTVGPWSSDHIVLGTAQFGMDYGIANNNGQVTSLEACNIIETAHSYGIRYIDTAHTYGNSEEIIGHHLNNHQQQDWLVITKVSDDKSPLTEHVKHAIDLIGQTPHAVLAHNASDYIGNSRFREELWGLKDSYDVKKIGLSAYSSKDINLALEKKIPEIIQVPINALDMRVVRSGILRTLKGEGVEIHARSVFLQGLFYLPQETLEQHFSSVIDAIGKLSDVAQKNLLSLSELSLLSVLSLPEIDKVVIGVNSADQLGQHISTIKQDIEESVVGDVLEIVVEDEMVLNPSNWKF